MERKNFLKSLVISAVSAPVILQACKKDSDSASPDATTTSSSTADGSAEGGCVVAPTETEGPFPTKQPASYVRNDITSDRTDNNFTIKITINNSRKSCAAVSGALVDIWHCDAE